MGCIKDRNGNILLDKEKIGEEMGRIHKGTVQ